MRHSTVFFGHLIAISQVYCVCHYRCSILTHNLCKIIKDHTKQLHRQLAADRAVAAAAPVAALTDGFKTSNSAIDRCDDGANGTDCDDDRWKLIVHIVLGQDSDQSVLLSSRCIWNADTDCLASATYRNNSLFAVATVYGLRCDNGTTPAVVDDAAGHVRNAADD